MKAIIVSTFLASYKDLDIRIKSPECLDMCTIAQECLDMCTIATVSYSFNSCLLSTYCMSCPVPGTELPAVKRTNVALAL